MIYSCFDHGLGMYRYYADERGHATNGDLAVPKLPVTSSKIGTSSLEAGRPLPSGAKPTGTGFRARGIVVRCAGDGTSLGALGAPGENTSCVTWLVGGIGIGLVVALFVNAKFGGRE
jgi:hypothetical protein